MFPLLFMGEEYGEAAPFQYFTSHGDAALVEAVRSGRREEFARFDWVGDLPDPQDEQTFLRSKLDWNLKNRGEHQLLWDFYRELLRLRRETPALAQLDKKSLEVIPLPREKTLFVRRWTETNQVLILFHFGEELIHIPLPVLDGRWGKTLDSADRKWGGSGSHVPDTLIGGNDNLLSVCPWNLLLFTEI